MFGATANEPDLLHATGFDAPDPVGAVRFPGGRTLLVVGSMELGRARRQSREGVEVLGPAALGFAKGDRAGPEDLLAAALSREGVADVVAASSFPLGAVLALERRGVRVAKAARNPVAAEREVKTADELRKIRRAQSAARAAERAVGAAIRAARPDARGRLVLGGRLLTSERARALVRETLLAHGCMDLEGTIVAGGRQAADPHESGHGPLRADEWIVCDIFPRDLRTGYWGDMTRTFMNGRPSAKLRRLYRAVADAQRLALSLVRPGAKGSDVHAAVVRFFEEAGWPSGRDATGRPYGFFHGTGHGVGLQIHEEPRLSVTGGELAPGMVVTVEPGLYYPDLGGVRIEDTVAVAETGREIL